MAVDLWQIRRRNRLTIDELSRQTGIPTGLIKAYELGQRSISERDLELLAEALQVDAATIKVLSDPPPRGPSRSSSSAFGAESGPARFGESGGSRYEGGFDRRGFGESSSSSRYDRPDFGSSRPRYDRPSSGSSRYGGGDYGRSRYGDRPRSNYDRRSDRAPDRDRRPGGFRDESRGHFDSKPRKSRARRRQQAGPARPTQIEHLKALLVRLDMSGDDFLRLAGKPLSMLNRKEAARLLTTCQEMLAEQKPPLPKGKRQRPYLPESVDEHELIYLTELQTSRRALNLRLFNGDSLEGTLLGFSPYAFTLLQPSGEELTVQKLAIAYYSVQPRPEGQKVEEGAEEEVTVEGAPEEAAE